MLGRKLFWSICVLHTNELPLRHLITSIDGPTLSDTGFTGPCAVCCLGWLTTAQSLVYIWAPKAWTDWQKLNTLEILVKYCLQVYFKLYYDIKVHHRLEGGPKHILTHLSVMRSRPKKVQKAVTFYVRTGAWFRTLRMCPPLADGESE
ncbi:hypothetical protein GWK47_017453 [Chionoecetes opilio]|uniref:Uncharacterized protein n=1 Tax=Chionoecetes opilio TaxID=41210 RepID=A0A8J4XQX4_CHIOP|nr:hypothetical protein GWK47_017453 [Chionoecetes opilio]